MLFRFRWLALGFTLAAVPGSARPDVGARAPEVSWRPERPVQGHLFVIRVGDGSGASIVGVRGRAGGEELHFAPTADGAFESLAPAPIDAESVSASLSIRLADGSEVSEEREIRVASGDYRHERLTVAPRFGAPPDSADQARLASDQAKARAVAAEAHRTARLWGDEVRRPRESRVTSGFGNGREFNGRISSRHMGLDLDGEPGDTVVAAARGVVALVDDFLLAGNIVYVNHGGGLLSAYFHLSEQLVQPGDTVDAGTPIGRVGATGRVTGPHLHWVVRYGTTSVDPRSLLEVAGR